MMSCHIRVSLVSCEGCREACCQSPNYRWCRRSDRSAGERAITEGIGLMLLPRPCADPRWRAPE